MALPKLELLSLSENSAGWGPSGPSAENAATPFQLFNKGDRIGRVADWIGVERYFRRGNERYNERLYGSAATAGNQFDYVHGVDENFQLVDSSRPVQKSTQRNFRLRQMQIRKLMQKEQERKEITQQSQNVRTKRSIAKEQQRAYKMWQRRIGNSRPGQRGGGRFFDRPKERLPSVQVRPEWTIIEEMNFLALNKLSLPTVGAGQDINGHQYGTLQYYDKTFERISVKSAVPLQKCAGLFYNVSTTEDPVIAEIAQSGIGNVFATDIVIATLMSATRSVYSWDIVAYRVGDKLFFDKRSTGGISNPVETLTVSETSSDPPAAEGNSINNAKDLATEAFYINQNFKRQVVRRNEESYKMTHVRAKFEEEGTEELGTAYKYRKWNLGNGVNGQPVELVCRTELDGVTKSQDGKVQTLTIKSFNEWDSSQSGGVDWREKSDDQKGAILAAEIKNNSAKVAKWTIQALLSASDAIKLGYVSRAAVRNSAQHVILGVQTFKPEEFATNIALKMENSWGILRCIIDSCMKQKPGKYLLMKDPQSPIIRLYSLPEGTFESEHETEEEESDDDQ